MVAAGTAGLGAGRLSHVTSTSASLRCWARGPLPVPQFPTGEGRLARAPWRCPERRGRHSRRVGGAWAAPAWSPLRLRFSHSRGRAGESVAGVVGFPTHHGRGGGRLAEGAGVLGSEDIPPPVSCPSAQTSSPTLWLCPWDTQMAPGASPPRALVPAHPASHSRGGGSWAWPATGPRHSLACRRFAPISACMSPWRCPVCVRVHVSPFDEDARLWIRPPCPAGPRLTRFHLRVHLTVQQMGHLSFWELGLQHWNFGGSQFTL